MKHSKGFGKPLPGSNNQPKQQQKLQQAFALAVQKHQEGRLPEAEAAYRQIIGVDPGFADAHYNLGHLLLQTGQPEGAEASYRQAATLKPGFFEAHHNLGQILLQRGKLVEAEESLRRALLLRPEVARAYSDLGSVLWLQFLQQGESAQEKLLDAEAHFRRAITLDPGCEEALNGLGAVLFRQKQYEAAATSYRRAIARRPDFAEAHNNLGEALLEQGRLQNAPGKLIEAETSFRLASAFRTDFPEAHNGLGSALLEQARVQNAPDKLVEAEARLQQAVTLKPSFAEAHYNLGNTLLEQMRLVEAEASFQRTAALWTDFAEVRASLACLRLQLGDFAAGWPGYEWRWRTRLMGLPRTFYQPAWDGSDLTGRTILLHAEQGHGDAIQFIRYASLVKAKGATAVLVECRIPELRLFETCNGIDGLVRLDDPLPEFDWHVPLMSLPLLLGTELETIPAEIPYLHGPESCALPLELQRQLEEAPGLKVGLVWTSKLGFSVDYKRRCPPELLAPLFALPGVSWFSLYKGDQTGDLEPYAAQVVDVGSHCTDFADTAWAIERLDLVITVDTAVAHLAGALGKPVWVLLPFVPDWRWLLEREDSPWYPSARLFRQLGFGDWPFLIVHVQKALRQKLTGEVVETPEVFVRPPQERRAASPQRDHQFELAAQYQQAGQLQEAVALFQQILQRQPDHGEALHRLGVIAQTLGNPVAAEPLLRRALTLLPEDAHVHYSLAVALEAQGKLTEAEDFCRRALALKPAFPEAYNILGNIQIARGELVISEASYRQALALNPDFVEAHGNLGNTLLEQGRFAEALTSYSSALALNPDHGESRGNIAFYELLVGNLKAGFSGYEWRLRVGSAALRSFPQPTWDGADLKGKTILLWAEQGYGDAIQFVRFAALVKAMGATVILECRNSERRLFETCSGIDYLVIDGDALPAFAVQAPLLSLPILLGTDLDTIPATVPYLRAPAPCRLSVECQRQLDQATGLKVGLVWSATTQRYVDRKRRYPIAALAPLFEIPGLSWFSLYKGSQLPELEPYREQVVDLGSYFTDFADTAWAIEQLDLVITVDTSVAHLTGALGKPVWILLSYVPDWRWLLERSDSPWYPTARLFRPQELGEWQTVVAQVAQSLRSLVGASQPVEAPDQTAQWIPIPTTDGWTEQQLQVQRLLGLARWHEQANRLQDARLIYTELLRVQPEHLDALNNLGTLYYKLGELETAESLLGQALALRPKDGHLHFNLAMILEAQGRTAEVETACVRALALEPTLAEAYNTLGNALVTQDRFREAEVSFRQALALRPDFAGTRTNLGNILQELGRFDEAIACFEQAIAQKPDLAHAHNNLALASLLLGDYCKGWSEYQWRWQAGAAPPRTFTPPLWDGSDLVGKTILLWAEQGHGDTIQFVRFASLIKAMGATVILECRPVEGHLLQSCPGIDRLVLEGEALPPFDSHAPLMSLPGLFETELGTIPAQIPYLKAPEGCNLSRVLKHQLEKAPGFKIGLVWSPKQVFPIDRKRRCPLAHFAPLFEIPGLSWFSLYKGDQIRDLDPYHVQVMDVGSHCTDFADTAWAIERLDLVITVDTAVAHLAGALGKPVWVLLPFVPDWRWLLGRKDSPWYPTARLFRQPDSGNWAAVIEQVQAALAAHPLR